MLRFYDKSRFNVFAASYEGGVREQWLKDNNIPYIIDNNDEKLIEWIKSKDIDIVLMYRSGFEEHRDIKIVKESNISLIIERNCFAQFDDSEDRHIIDKHVFCSASSQDIYKGRAADKYDASKCGVIYCPTDNEFFGQPKIDYSSLNFGRYSRNDITKWYRISIMSLPFIRDEIPEAKFHVIGMPDYYKTMALESNVLDMIVEHEAPKDSDLIDFMSKISVLAHSSSLGESFGNVLAESMAARLPIVTHYGGDCAQAELVTNDFNGFIVDPNDAKAYADKIIFLLKNPLIKKQMGENGRRRTLEFFDAKTVVQNFENLYLWLE